MSVTLKQIAEEVGVSQPLVTYALNNKPGVSEKNRIRILEAAQRMGYEGANKEAQLLISKRFGKRLPTGIIALVYSRTPDTPLLATPFYRGLMEGVEWETEKRGLDLLITPMRDGTLPKIARAGKVDGLIFASIPLHAEEEAAGLSLPAVTLATHAASFFNLLPDNKAGMRLAAKYLLDLGHRKIGYLGMSRGTARSARHLQADDRLAGYCRALTEGGLDLNDELIAAAENCLEENGAEALDTLLNRAGWRKGEKLPFSALACHNDTMAMGAIRRAQDLGLHVPNDLSVVGFDDIAGQFHFRPTLASVTFSRFDMGKRAVELVCDQFSTLYPEKGEGTKVTPGVESFPIDLVVGESTREWTGA